MNIPGIKTGNRRTANVKSVGYSDLLRLTKDDLWEALVDYPENKRFLIEKGVAKLKKDNLLEEDEGEEGDDEHVEKNSQIKKFTPKIGVDENFKNLEKKLETIEQRNEETLNSLKQSCESIKNRIENVKLFYKQKVGITV